MLKKGVTVTTNDRDQPRLKLEGTTTVMSALRVDPKSVNFGQVKRESAGETRTVKIHRGDGGPLTPSVINTGNPQIFAELKEVTAGEEYDLVVEVKPPWPNGILRGNIMMDTGVEKAAQESIVVYANVAPRLKSLPSRFMIARNNDVDKDRDLVARLQWSENKPAKLTGATTNDNKMTVTIEEADGKQSLVLHVPAGYIPTRRTGINVTVTTDDPEVPSMQVPVYVTNNQSAGGKRGAAVQSSLSARKAKAAAAAKGQRRLTGTEAAQSRPRYRCLAGKTGRAWHR